MVRLQADHSVVPAFYRYLQAQTEEKQIESGIYFHVALEGLVALLERAERELVGPGGVQARVITTLGYQLAMDWKLSSE